MGDVALHWIQTVRMVLMIAVVVILLFKGYALIDRSYGFDDDIEKIEPEKTPDYSKIDFEKTVYVSGGYNMHFFNPGYMSCRSSLDLVRTLRSARV